MKKYLLILACSLYYSLTGQIPTTEWQNTIGGYNDDYLNSLTITLDGGYVIGGDSYSGSNGDKTEGKIGESDYWVLKLSITGDILWQNTIGGTSLESLRSVIETSDGGFLLCGYSSSDISGDKSESSFMGSYDYWILKLDASGNIVWQNTIGGNANDKAHCVIETADGGFLIGGESDSGISGDKSEGSLGGTDYWIVKLNSSGSIVWQNTIGGNSYDGLFSMDNTIDGGFILGGYSLSTISGDKSESSFMGSYDYWILKLDASGNIVWQNSIGGNASDKLKKIIALSDGNFIVGGTSASGISGDKTEGNHLDDYWVLKLGASGNIIWQKTISGNSADILQDIKENLDGSLIVGGSSISDIGYDKSELCIGPSLLNDYWVIKLDEHGNLIWENTIGGNKSDDLRSICITNDGGFIMGGYSLSDIFEDKSEANWNTNTYDFWVLKLGSETPECAQPADLYTDNITSNSAKIHWNDEPTSLNYKVFYRPVGAGTWLKKNATLNFKNLTDLSPSTEYEYKIKNICSEENSEFSIIEYFTTLTLRSEEIELHQFSIFYPNPTTDFISINLNSSANTYLLNIYDLLGNLVFTNNNIVSIQYNLDFLSPGIYILTVDGENSKFCEKLIRL